MDKIKAKLDLLEAQYGRLKAEVKRQREELKLQREALDVQREELDNQKEELEKRRKDNDKQEAELQAYRAELSEQKKNNAELKQRNLELSRRLNRYRVEGVEMVSQLDDLKDSLHDLDGRVKVQQAHEHVSRRVSFHARLSSNQEVANTSPVILDRVFTNEGDAYDPITGVFTVPVSGTYAFFVTLGTNTSGTYAAVLLMIDEGWTAYANSHCQGGHEGSSCHTVIGLHRGQRVWLKCDGPSSYFCLSTSFSGFLLHPD